MMKIMIDACVLLDVFQRREPFYEESKKVVLACASGDFHGMVTANTLTDIAYIMHRKLKDVGKTKQIISQIFDTFEVVDTTARSCLEALRSPVSDYEDAVLVECAAESFADCIATRDLGDYADSKINAVSPAWLVEKYNLDEFGLSRLA